MKPLFSVLLGKNFIFSIKIYSYKSACHKEIFIAVIICHKDETFLLVSF